MGIVAGDIEIAVEDETLPLMIERCIVICGKTYCVYKKTEDFDPKAQNRVRHTFYLREAPFQLP